MNKDRIEGAAKQFKGTVKEATGRVLGDAKLVAEGRADKVTNLSVMFWAVSVMYSISIMFPISTVSDPSTMAVMRSEP